MSCLRTQRLAVSALPSVLHSSVSFSSRCLFSSSSFSSSSSSSLFERGGIHLSTSLHQPQSHRRYTSSAVSLKDKSDSSPGAGPRKSKFALPSSDDSSSPSRQGVRTEDDKKRSKDLEAKKKEIKSKQVEAAKKKRAEGDAKKDKTDEKKRLQTIAVEQKEQKKRDDVADLMGGKP